MKTNTKIFIGIGSALAIAFLTRKYWAKSTAEIKITNTNWDENIITYDLYLQGENMGTKEISTSADYNQTYKLDGNKRYTLAVGKVNDVMFITVYKGDITGVPTKDLAGLTLACKGINYTKKVVVDCKNL